MKGIIFTEFIDMVENVYGLEVADRVIEESDLPSGGAYTAIGTYDHKEMVEIVTHLSRITGEGVPNLLEKYGIHVFSIFVKSYPSFFDGVTESFDFLDKLETIIHPEVLKIYPEAELPSFETKRDNNEMTMVYYSKRKMSDFARGLIRGCLTHFQDDAEINTKQLDEDGSKVEFHIVKR